MLRQQDSSNSPRSSVRCADVFVAAGAFEGAEAELRAKLVAADERRDALLQLLVRVMPLEG